MFKFICFVLCFVTVSLKKVNNHKLSANPQTFRSGPTTVEDVYAITLECAKEHGVSNDQLQEISDRKDTTVVKPCFWACSLMRTGFMNDKGQYVLYPGLTYVRQFTNYEAYSNLEAIAKRCESVKEEVVSDGVAGCEMGALIAACLLKEFLSQGIRF